MRNAILRELMTEYEQLRAANAREELRRREEVSRRCPEIAAILEQRQQLIFQGVRNVLDGQGSAENLPQQMEVLTARLEHLLQENGYPVEMVPGVPSFCAVAAKLNISLAEGAQPLHVIPASYQGVEEGLEWSGPKILMKTGHSMKKVKELMREKGILDKAKMVQKCGMEGEEIYESMEQVDENSSYFSVIVVKD